MQCVRPNLLLPIYRYSDEPHGYGELGSLSSSNGLALGFVLTFLTKAILNFGQSHFPPQRSSQALTTLTQLLYKPTN